MAPDPKTQAAMALHRFGFGPRAGALALIATDPRGAILAELDRPGADRIADVDLLTTGEAARAAFDYRQEKMAGRLALRADREATQAEAKKAAEVAKAADKTDMAQAGGIQADAVQASAPAKANPGPGIPQQIFFEEAKARFDSALNAEIGLIDRLTWFWSNHFCVSADKGPVRALCGAFEREAIRANVLGKFADMLVAVESHPAMLLYLDNAGSIGPNSIAGQRRGKGINENLAREILELHTLGVNGGYSQDDVTSFAKVMTGWTFSPLKQDSQHGGEFVFNDRMHEPGAQSLLSRSYDDSGYGQGHAVLLTLARHPATAKHIATKLVRHFIADDPPPALVTRLAKRFLDTGGDFKDITKTLLTSQESWDAPRSKLKRPAEWIVSSMRASGLMMSDVRRAINTLNLLGEPLWRPPAPKGFSDDSAAWLDGLALRLDIANEIACRIGGMTDPEAVADDALGPLASAETRQTIARAESRQQALALLLMSPEFQRR
jgi:uncharacterized protein (DUF1800 family)